MQPMETSGLPAHDLCPLILLAPALSCEELQAVTRQRRHGTAQQLAGGILVPRFSLPTLA